MQELPEELNNDMNDSEEEKKEIISRGNILPIVLVTITLLLLLFLLLSRKFKKKSVS